MWNPSTCECQCDKWCKAGQYLDHKYCVCKNKLIGRLTEECTSIINETMINNKDNITNDNTYLILFIAFLIGFIVLLIAFIYYCRRSNSNKKIKRFYLSKSRNFDLLNLPLNMIIEFHSLVINISCVITKTNEYYPKIYLNECSYNKT